MNGGGKGCGHFRIHGAEIFLQRLKDIGIPAHQRRLLHRGRGRRRRAEDTEQERAEIPHIEGDGGPCRVHGSGDAYGHRGTAVRRNP